MNENIQIINTHTGKIFINKERRLEFLTVGDYGKENNIKADFLGLHKEIYGVPHHKVDLSDKWVATISTQKGCPMKCKFCDCPTYGFYGNCSLDDLKYQVSTIIRNVTKEDFPSKRCLFSSNGEAHLTLFTKRFNLHFARMGEPTFNRNVLNFTKNELKMLLYTEHVMTYTIHPVVSTMLPKSNSNLNQFLLEWCEIKNTDYHGEAGLQFSINSTDDAQRQDMFNDMSLSLKEISEIAKSLPKPVGRKYTLNFAVTNETILDVNKLNQLFNKEDWIVKITPIHQTKKATENGFDVGDSYNNYDVYRKFEQPLVEAGWDVIVFVPSIEEDADRITCGNALISYNK